MKTKDYLGNEINIDEYFAYFISTQKYHQLSIFQFKGLTDKGRVKAKVLRRASVRGWTVKRAELGDTIWDNKIGNRPTTDDDRKKHANKLHYLDLMHERSIKLYNFKEAE